MDVLTTFGSASYEVVEVNEEVDALERDDEVAVLSLLLVVIGVVVFIINLKRKRLESASVNGDIKYNFEFETFAEDSKTITAEEVEEKLAKADDGELHTIDIETLSSDEYGDIDYLE